MNANHQALAEYLESRINKRFDQIDSEFKQVYERFDQVDSKFNTVYERFDVVDGNFKDVNRRINILIDHVDIKNDDQDDQLANHELRLGTLEATK